MSITKYTESGQVVKEINELKTYLQKNPLNVSDIRDNVGHQYVDLVQEGGGVLGIALLGYTYALEQVGIRFFCLGGTSAGAINAAMLAAVGKPNEAKSEKILEILDSTNLMKFIDGGRDAQKLVKSISDGDSIFKLIFQAFGQIDDIIRGEKGVNRGDYFLAWLKESFAKFGIKTTQDILDKINDFPPELYEKAKRDIPTFNCKKEDFVARLSIIASDITTQTKANLPEMADLYYKEPMNVNPAHFVRASMSIPLFFDPVEIELIPKGIDQINKWQDEEKAYYFGDIPDKVVMVDGGVMSNFPIDIFHISKGTPCRPTFGVKLGIDRQSQNTNRNIFRIIWNSFSAARQMRDHDVIIKNQDFIRLISNIDDSGINWLDFNLSDEDKVTLFYRGVVAACEFIKNFDWKEYKKLRGEIIETKEKFEQENIQEQFSRSFLKNVKKRY